MAAVVAVSRNGDGHSVGCERQPHRKDHRSAVGVNEVRTVCYVIMLWIVVRASTPAPVQRTRDRSYLPTGHLGQTAVPRKTRWCTAAATVDSTRKTRTLVLWAPNRSREHDELPRNKNATKKGELPVQMRARRTRDTAQDTGHSRTQHIRPDSTHCGK